MFLKSERACLLCGILRTFDEFYRDGCPNCDSVLRLQSSEENIHACTSPSFEGLSALSSPSKSWVAQWMRDDKFQPGLYAVQVKGRLPDEIIQSLRSQSVYYRPRDGSVQD
ncbi:Spt4/RpoE2 zinc finger-domain-containing protein [Lipomyces oligophaga]|uniref:Spt4/RpoE2 zinc finger-domain-containing protein n=1 Tax=Lipomyces oligophaga TaxID=45792 RepID=UPI0034CEB34A